MSRRLTQQEKAEKMALVIGTESTNLVRLGPYDPPIVEDTLWHYAVWKTPVPHRWPACWSAKNDQIVGIMEYPGVIHGHTIIRGDVNCPDCLRMMGS